MRNTFFIFCCILIASCDKQDNCTPSSQSFTFQSNKAIDTSSREVKTIDGSSRVFKFQYNYEQCQGVVGAPLSRQVYFEVPAAVQNNFSYTDESFQQTNAVVYLTAPIDPSLRIKQIISGAIQGTQVNPTKWHITGSLNLASETINFEEEFVRAD